VRIGRAALMTSVLSFIDETICDMRAGVAGPVLNWHLPGTLLDRRGWAAWQFRLVIVYTVAFSGVFRGGGH